MTALPVRLALLAGNFITGLVVMAPAAMLHPLAEGLNVSVRDAGLLVTYGAVILCIASPLVAWLTSGMDRRTLLVGSLATVALAHLASAFATSYPAVLALRLVMLFFAAVFTPQAAGTVALLVPEKDRPGAIAFVFIGWSLSIAVGMPLMTFLATSFGWRFALAALGVGALLTGVFVFAALPGRLKGASLSLSSWAAIGRDRVIFILLAITILQISGQLVVFTFMGPSLSLIGAGPSVIALFFGLFGVASFVGNIIASRIVAPLGAFVTSGISTGMVATGLLLWGFGGSLLWVMGIGVAIWGLGFAASNAMQQARLYGAAPALAAVTVALNTSAVYVGQAAGSYVSGEMFTRDLTSLMGYAGAGFVLVAWMLWWVTRPRAVVKTA
ncbi:MULTISPECIES: MFS transporter [unclassified Beijerinckia]|uniref:MFS transporter n=1 Tax=unclassified Beijerinckia TaxID=2638183 RepID=UPI0008952B8B|nr:MULTISPECIES: MFS transporter [unclassified Beijerinckia]MDH7799334.1 DHA1 family inner membrane transport protein [Beijerinckia sp. GAS462]SED46619.1 Predicted arabinose efflux permease, MFS family [Beijerinckia sp. 28-YEA-48]